MWFIGVEVEQETSAPPPTKNPGSAPDSVSASNEKVVRRKVCFKRLTKFQVKKKGLIGLQDYYQDRLVLFNVRM